MMKFFLLALACLLAAVSARTVDYERVMRLVRRPDQVLMHNGNVGLCMKSNPTVLLLFLFLFVDVATSAE